LLGGAIEPFGAEFADENVVGFAEHIGTLTGNRQDADG
jgi:hypothetical protein